MTAREKRMAAAKDGENVETWDDILGYTEGLECGSGDEDTQTAVERRREGKREGEEAAKDGGHVETWGDILGWDTNGLECGSGDEDTQTAVEGREDGKREGDEETQTDVEK